VPRLTPSRHRPAQRVRKIALFRPLARVGAALVHRRSQRTAVRAFFVQTAIGLLAPRAIDRQIARDTNQPSVKIALAVGADVVQGPKPGFLIHVIGLASAVQVPQKSIKRTSIAFDQCIHGRDIAVAIAFDEIAVVLFHSVKTNGSGILL